MRISDWSSDVCSSDLRFRQPFFYRLVRHPLYAGLIIAFWATPEMTLGHMLFSVGMTIYILIAIPYEERDLVGALGDDYASYRGRVGMLFPRLRDRKSTRLNPVTNAHLVCRLLLEKKKKQDTTDY